MVYARALSLYSVGFGVSLWLYAYAKMLLDSLLAFYIMTPSSKQTDKQR